MSCIYPYVNGILYDAVLMMIGFVAGKWLKKLITNKDEIEKYFMIGIALSCLLVGVSGVVVRNLIICSISLIIGPVVGYWFHLDKKLEVGMNNIMLKFFHGTDSESFIKPLSSFFMLTLIGSLSINGPIKNVIQGESSLMMIKACLDGLTVFVFSITYEANHFLRVAIPTVVLFDMAMSAVAYLSVAYLSVSPEILINSVIDVSAVGSVLIIILGLNILNVTDLSTINLLPAIFIALVFAI